MTLKVQQEVNDGSKKAQASKVSGALQGGDWSLPQRSYNQLFSIGKLQGEERELEVRIVGSNIFSIQLYGLVQYQDTKDFMEKLGFEIQFTDGERMLHFGCILQVGCSVTSFFSQRVSSFLVRSSFWDRSTTK